MRGFTVTGSTQRPGSARVLAPLGCVLVLVIATSASAASWSTEFGAFLGPDTSVHALAVVGGELIVAGNFSHVGQLAAHRVARWDGAQWLAMDAPVAGALDHLAVEGGMLYAQSGTWVGRWDGSAWVEVAPATLASISINAFAVFAGDPIVAGSFESIDGVAANSIARWDGTQWQALGLGLREGSGGCGPSSVFDLAIFGGELVAGGAFANAGMSTAANVARWNGSSWSALGAGVTSPDPCNAFVQHLGVDAGVLFAAGRFAQAGGLPASDLATWDGMSWTPGPSVSGLTGFVSAGGEFLACTASTFESWNGSGWDTWATAPFVSDVCAGDAGALYSAGPDGQFGGQSLYNVARFDGGTWNDLFALEGGGLDQSVSALALFQGAVVASGGFTTSASGPVERLATWDGAAWQPFTSAAPLVNAMLVRDAQLYIGGQFGTIDAATYNSVARWNGTGWDALGSGLHRPREFAPGTEPAALQALVEYQGDVVAAGDMCCDGAGVPLGTQGGVVRWTGSAWEALGTGLGGGTVRSLFVHGDSLIAAGDFTDPAKRVAIWDGTSWVGVGNISGGTAFSALAWHDEIYALGQLQFSGGVTFTFARWDGAFWNPISGTRGDWRSRLAIYDDRIFWNGWLWDGAWEALDGGLSGGSSSGPRSFTTLQDGPSLWVGGWFTRAGSTPAFNVARWDDAVTSTEVQSLFAVETERGVRLQWWLSNDAHRTVTAVLVQQCDTQSGPFVNVSPPLAPAPEMSWHHTSTKSGPTSYRILLLRDGSVVGVAGPIQITRAGSNERTPLLSVTQPGRGESIKIEYVIGTPGALHLALHDVRGRMVRRLAHGAVLPGSHLRTWDRRDATGRRVPRGVYFVRLVLDRTQTTRKFVLTH